MNNKKEKLLILLGLFIMFILLSVVVPILLNEFIPYGNGNVGTGDSWLSFWGTWLGAIFGGFITIVGIYFTLQSSNKQFEQSLKEQRESYESDRDLNLMPHIKIVQSSNHQYNDSQIIKFNNSNKNNGPKGSLVEVTNIGLGSAINIKVKIDNQFGKSFIQSQEHTFDLGVNESRVIKVELSNYPDGEYCVQIEYSDIINHNKYIQKGKFVDNFHKIVLEDKKQKILLKRP